MRRTALLVLSLVGCAAAADAQTVRGYGDVGLEVFSAANSFKAIFGQPSAPLFGGGLELGLSKRFFISAGAARVHRTGHRVFVFQNQVFTLNEPADVTITPLDFTLGYRFRPSAFVPYIGAGAGWLRYTETSPHVVAGDSITMSHWTTHALAGLEVPMSPWLAAAVEAQYTSAPKAFGTEATSVANLYNEHDLGGFTIRAKVVIGR